MLTELTLCMTLSLLAADAPVDQAKSPQQSVEEKKGEETKFKLTKFERRIVDRTNAQRARYKLAALEVDEELVESARTHCQWMTRNETLQHTKANVAENIAFGQVGPEEAVADWMKSPGHRANILERGYRRIGVAAYRAGEGRIYWCQQFLR